MSVIEYGDRMDPASRDTLKCDQCGKVMPDWTDFLTSFLIDDVHFCSKECRQEYLSWWLQYYHKCECGQDLDNGSRKCTLCLEDEQ